MNIHPRKFLLALQAGLTLCGQDEDREPEYIGEEYQWEEYQTLLDKYEL